MSCENMNGSNVGTAVPRRVSDVGFADGVQLDTTGAIRCGHGSVGYVLRDHWRDHAQRASTDRAGYMPD